MGEALPEWRAENEIIVLRTLLRREAYVRADCQPNDDLPALLESNDLARECLQHFNYRMSGGRFRHYCAGCCLSLDDVKAKSFSLMLRADATLANDSNQATLDNWETAGLACGKIGFGTLAYAALPRSLLRSLPDWPACQRAGVQVDNAESVKMAKKHTARKWYVKVLAVSLTYCSSVSSALTWNT